MPSATLRALFSFFWRHLRDRELSSPRVVQSASWRIRELSSYHVNYLWLADWCHQWQIANCLHRRFVVTSFLLVDGCAYSRPFCVLHCFSVQPRYVFASEQNDATSLVEYFSATVLNVWVLDGSSFHSVRGKVGFEHRTNASQGSVATRLSCGFMFNYCFARNLLVSLPVKEFWKSVSNWQS